MRSKSSGPGFRHASVVRTGPRQSQYPWPALRAGLDVLTGEDLTQKRTLETVETSRRMSSPRYRAVAVIAAIAWVGIAAAIRAQDGQQGGQEGFRFTSGIDLVNVTATVTDSRGRFVDELKQDDFAVFENGKRQEVSHFSAGKVPVSLGIALDTSGSMTPEKMDAARAAINRLIFELLDREDELFFMRFSSEPRLMQGWTTDRQAIARAVERVDPVGGTAIYDAITRALPVAAAGQHRKKAILVISDGNDTSSSTSVGELRKLIRESEVLVYALGVDGTEQRFVDRQPLPPRPTPRPFPWPGPGAGRGRQRFPPFIIGGGGGRTPRLPPQGDRVNADALREFTDDSGGRTEIVRGFSGLEEATTRLADELSKQYSLGYASSEPKDGQWHAIRVEVRDRKLQVRARRGFVAS